MMSSHEMAQNSAEKSEISENRQDFNDRKSPDSFSVAQLRTIFDSESQLSTNGGSKLANGFKNDPSYENARGSEVRESRKENGKADFEVLETETAGSSIDRQKSVESLDPKESTPTEPQKLSELEPAQRRNEIKKPVPAARVSLERFHTPTGLEAEQGTKMEFQNLQVDYEDFEHYPKNHHEGNHEHFEPDRETRFPDFEETRGSESPDPYYEALTNEFFEGPGAEDDSEGPYHCGKMPMTNGSLRNRKDSQHVFIVTPVEESQFDGPYNKFRKPHFEKEQDDSESSETPPTVKKQPTKKRSFALVPVKNTNPETEKAYNTANFEQKRLYNALKSSKRPYTNTTDPPQFEGPYNGVIASSAPDVGSHHNQGTISKISELVVVPSWFTWHAREKGVRQISFVHDMGTADLNSKTFVLFILTFKMVFYMFVHVIVKSIAEIFAIT